MQENNPKDSVPKIQSPSDQNVEVNLCDCEYVRTYCMRIRRSVFRKAIAVFPKNLMNTEYVPQLNALD